MNILLQIALQNKVVHSQEKKSSKPEKFNDP